MEANPSTEVPSESKVEEIDETIPTTTEDESKEELTEEPKKLTEEQKAVSEEQRKALMEMIEKMQAMQGKLKIFTNL